METKFTCRWALLGLSSIAITFVDDLLLPRAENESIHHVIAAVSTTKDAEIARGWLADRKVSNVEEIEVFLSFEDMLQKGNFDAVYISTPHPLHYQHAKLAISNGRNVLLEKPATMNRPQFQKLVEMAKEKQVVLMEAMWTRYLPVATYLQKVLLPKVGRVRRVFSDLSVPIAGPSIPSTSRLMDKEAGAGALLDMGVYAVTWVDIAFGGSKATEVIHAHSLFYNTGNDLIDDINTVLLSDPFSQSVGIVTTSLSMPGSNSHPDKLSVKKVAPAVRIEAEKAQISIPFPLIRPQELHVEWYGTEDTTGDGAEKLEDIRMPVTRGWGLWYQADIIADRVKDQKQNGGEVIGEEESLRVLGWLDEARRLAGIKYSEKIEAV
jgi:predicted dehydrogenase